MLNFNYMAIHTKSVTVTSLESIEDFNFSCAFKLKVRSIGLFTDVVARWVAGSFLVLAGTAGTQTHEDN